MVGAPNRDNDDSGIADEATEEDCAALLLRSFFSPCSNNARVHSASFDKGTLAYTCPSQKGVRAERDAASTNDGEGSALFFTGLPSPPPAPLSPSFILSADATDEDGEDEDDADDAGDLAPAMRNVRRSNSCCSSETSEAEDGEEGEGEADEDGFASLLSGIASPSLQAEKCRHRDMMIGNTAHKRTLSLSLTHK